MSDSDLLLVNMNKQSVYYDMECKVLYYLEAPFHESEQSKAEPINGLALTHHQLFYQLPPPGLPHQLKRNGSTVPC